MTKNLQLKIMRAASGVLSGVITWFAIWSLFHTNFDWRTITGTAAWFLFFACSTAKENLLKNF
jgi:hypothetical protein